jgi:hypothetical protein
MSNFLWTEKQIQAAVKRLRHKKGWLGVADIRSGNKAKATEYRQLMSILVRLNNAFDNMKNCEEPNYKICFNWEQKDQIIKSLEAHRSYFSPGLLSCSAMTNLPPSKLVDDSDTVRYLGRPLTEGDSEQFWRQRLRWRIMVEALRNFQDSGKLRISPEYDYFVDKHFQRNWLAILSEIALMYKALEIGWSEIKDDFPKDSTYDDVFVTFLSERSYVELIEECRLPDTRIKPAADIKRMKSITKILPAINNYYSESTRVDSIDNSQKTFTGKDYGADLDELKDASKAIKSMGARTSVQNIWADEMNSLKNALLQSSNPEVRQAALEWEKAIQKSFLAAKRLIQKSCSSKDTE